MTAGDLRQLRCRMGWCQAEMARRLNCHVDLVSQYESGAAQLEEAHRRELSSIFYQAESAADKTIRRPVAEVMMRDRGISQIHDLDVLDSWAAPDATFTER